jgi:hypothetical protein
MIFDYIRKRVSDAVVAGFGDGLQRLSGDDNATEFNGDAQALIDQSNVELAQFLAKTEPKALPGKKRAT